MQMLSLSKALIAPYAGLQVLNYGLQKVGGQPGRVRRPGAWKIQQELAAITLGWNGRICTAGESAGGDRG